jgi:large subunit ribosomal protein L25
MDVKLTAQTGRPIGSRSSGRLRAQGKVPGVVYGLGSEPVAVTVEWPDLRRALTTEAGLNALIDLTVGDTTSLSVIKDMQRDPVRRSVTHVDFMLIDRNAPLTVDVPLNLVGTAPALEAMKGMVDQLLYTLTVKAKPGSIPTAIDVDISSLDLGTQVRAGEIVLPEGVTTEVDPEAPVAQGSATRSTIILQQAQGKFGDSLDPDAEAVADEATATAPAS